MGVNIEGYVILGYKGDYNDFHSKKTLEEYGDEPEEGRNYYDVVEPSYWDKKEPMMPIILTDGMDGDYSCFGILIATFKGERYDGVDVGLSTGDIIEIKSILELAEDKYGVDTKGKELKLHIFEHCT